MQQKNLNCPSDWWRWCDLTNSCHCVVGNDIGRHPLGENHHEVAAGDQAGHQENHHHPQLKLTNHQNRRVKCFELQIQIDIKQRDHSHVDGQSVMIGYKCRVILRAGKQLLDNNYWSRHQSKLLVLV